MKAIVYTSNTGTTAQYATLLGEKTGLPVYTPAEAKNALAAGDEILYMGWLMAAGVQGYKAAAKQYKIAAVCAVGMGANGAQTEEVRQKNALPEELPLFTLQGGLQRKKLHGLYKLMINMVSGAAEKSLLQKKNRTPEDEVMLKMLHDGANLVKPESLQPVLDWYAAQQGQAQGR